MAQRVKGQEIEVVMLQDGAPVDNLTLARSLELSFKTELLQEGYLGETTDRYDTIFKGIKGKLAFHLDSPGAFKVVQSIIDKARRRTPGTRFNIKATLNFPSGRRARVVVRDAEFGELPFNTGSRADYTGFDIEFGASEAQVLAL
jgi:hypothetical protein